MKYFRLLNTKNKLLLSVAVLLIITSTTVLVEYLNHNFQNSIKLHRQQQLSQQLSLVRANLESELNANIFLADSLATIITVNPQSGPQEWEKLAETLFLKASSIRNIAIAPNNIVNFVYPLAGNEAVIGLDYRTLPEQFLTVELARQRQEIFIAGPLALIQGGNAVIARMPVFTNPPLNTQYWGTCSVVVDIDKLFTLAGVTALASQGKLAIRGKNGAGDQGDVFYGEQEIFEQAFATETIRLLSGSWVLALAEAPGSILPENQWFTIIVRLIGYTIGSLLLLVFVSLFYGFQLAQLNALQDPLTLLPNRRFTMQLLEKLVKSGSKFSILNLDVDNFKQVNDSYGHAVGDSLLQEVAKRLREPLRSYDTVCRLSGDEFLIVLPRVTRERDIESILNKLKGKFQETDFQTKGINLKIALSIGFASYPEDAQDLESLLHHADLAMYKQKEQHKMAKTKDHTQS
ncbi:sensor domain-containing diguanylate cyclase [Alishewanella longhuensis]|uniref:Sensor domain-containing diguanylate cyclase n=1 Tax=Alishewanella longhuensis TaxID=1091037 RepID=A0ABQ3KXX0_9ALTE|nr:diguanylate cyclase [Alishewanella longhuensis]GHG68968.1 sensor domain-containing diguanylate cyclase [Alishewanella longhuensis]